MKMTDLDPNVVPEIAAPPDGGDEGDAGAQERPQFGAITPAREAQAALPDDHWSDRRALYFTLSE